MKSRIQKFLILIHVIAPALCFGQLTNIVVGNSPNNEDGDTPRTAYQKINANELFLLSNGGGGPTNGTTSNQVVSIVGNILASIPTNAVLVSSTKGNDLTAAMGDATHPAKSMQYAILFVQTNSPSNGVVVANPGDSFSLDVYQPSGCTILASNTVTLYGNGSYLYFTNTTSGTVIGFQCNQGSVFSNFNYTLATPFPSSPGAQDPFGLNQAHIFWGEFLTVIGPADDFSPTANTYGAGTVNYPGIFHEAYCHFFGNWDNILPGPSVKSRTNSIWEYYNNTVLITNTLYPTATEISGITSFPLINGRLMFKNNTIEVYGITNTASYGATGVGLLSGAVLSGNPWIMENNSIIVTNSGAGSTNFGGVFCPISTPTNFSANASIYFLNNPTNIASLNWSNTPPFTNGSVTSTGQLWTNGSGAQGSLVVDGQLYAPNNGMVAACIITNGVSGDWGEPTTGTIANPIGYRYSFDVSPGDWFKIFDAGLNGGTNNIVFSRFIVK